jgi:hypothetical protein
MIVQEIIDRAEELAAGVAMDASKSPLVDSDMTAFTILPHALRYAVALRAKNGKGLSDIVEQHNIEINPVTQVGTLPDNALAQYANRATLPNFKWASYLEHRADYDRFKFDTSGQLCYFGVHNRQLRTSCMPIILGTPGLIATAGSNSINGDASRAQVGDRVYCVDSINGLVCDAIIDSITGATGFTIAGKARQSTSGLGVRAPSTIYDRQQDFVIRTQGTFTTSVGNATVAMTAGALTAADVGRRIQITSSGVVVVDAIILSVDSTTQATLGAQALSSHVGCTATVYGTGVVLEIPTIPDIPTTISDTLTVSAPVADDIITTIAAVLRGELSLAQIAELTQGL